MKLILDFLRSFWDILKFIQFTLSKSGLLAITLITMAFAFSLAFPRDYGSLTRYSIGLAIILFAINRIKMKNQNEFYGSISVEESEDRKKLIQKCTPSNYERDWKSGQGGFERVDFLQPESFPIVRSLHFNKTFLQNPTWDIKVEAKTDSAIFRSIQDRIKDHAFFHRKNITNLFLQQLFKLKPLTNEDKVAISSPFPPNETSKNINLFKTKYFSALCTSELARKKITVKHAEHTTTHEIAPLPLLYSTNSDGSRPLCNLHDFSLALSAHIGVDVIVVTSDWKMRLAKQSEKNIRSPGSRAPLGSGSMDWKDIDLSGSFKRTVLNTAERELEEEWFKKKKHFEPLKIENIGIIGYYRMPHRGGKPQFIALAKLSNDDFELRPNEEVSKIDEERALSVFEVASLDDLSNATQIVLSGDGDLKDSIPLLAAFECLKETIDKNPNYINELLGYKSHN